MNERQRAFKNPNTASTLLFSGFRENCSGVSGTSLMQLKQPHCCGNSSNEPTQNMHSRNSGRNNDSWLLENDLTSEEIYSSDFLKGFTGREPFEILPLQLWRRPQQKAGTESYLKKKKKNLPWHQQYGAFNQQSLETREVQRSFWTLKKGHYSGLRM